MSTAFLVVSVIIFFMLFTLSVMLLWSVAVLFPTECAVSIVCVDVNGRLFCTVVYIMTSCPTVLVLMVSK